MAASASAKTDSDPIRAGLERTLASGEFANSERMRRFLRFIVEETLAGRGDCLKETQIGIHVFDRVPGYDPKADAIVRVEARRLRSKLLEYAEQHRADPLVIELPKGGYLPAFRWRELSFETPKAAIPAELRRKFAWRWAVIPGVALLAGIIIASYWLGGRHQSFAAMQVRPFTTYPGYELGPAFSPDGENIAFCWAGPDGELDAIWVQAVQSDTPRRVTHSNFGEARPVWSPDGKQLAFLRTLSKDRSGVFIISVDGRNERKITEIAHTTAIGRVDWSPDGKYLVTSDQRSPGGPSSIVLLSLATAEPQRLTDPDSRIPGDTEPSFSPDGRTIAFRHSIGNAVDDIYLAPMPAAGTSLPLRSSHLKRLTFDNRGIDGHTWAPDGRSLIVSSTRGAGIHSLWRFRLSGGPPVRLSEAGLDAVQPSASLHGHRLAYVTEINDQNIWQDSIPSSAARVLIASTLLDSSPQFSPNGSRIAFRSNRSGSDEIWIADADGNSQRQVTHFNGPLTGSPRWSPDGKRLAFDSRATGNAEIYVMDAANPGAPSRFTNDNSENVVPSWSRDGRFIYFASKRSGTWQVWKKPGEGGGTPEQVTRRGGFMAFESEDGAWVFYNKELPKPSIWRVPVHGGEEELMIDSLKTEMWGNWAVGSKGLYFLDYRPQLSPAIAGIEFLDFSTRSMRELGRTSHKPTPWNTGLAISPDERRILFTQIDREGSDIMLGEGFR